MALLISVGAFLARDVVTAKGMGGPEVLMGALQTVWL